MKTVLITGAASGLGWEIAKVFHQRGDHLLLIDRDADGLTARATELKERVSTLACDLTDANAIEQISQQVDALGSLDVLVNNAGITQRSLAAKTNPAVMKKVMAVDWQAPMELALALLPALYKTRGAIINIGSMAGWMPVPGRAGYCAAKSALAQFFEVLRMEEADNGIHVLMVYPSFLDTPIEKNALGGDGQPAKHARSTVGRIDDAGELARNIVKALDQRKPRLFPNRFTLFASILWRIAPGFFQRMTRKRFAVELEQR
ncbi:short-subunit dehydrogenase [Litorivivens lipolytica]|uniref:Short-subunit dehydrogenase n=1 Tax=Litorivivens lipolytica TaxID=1524264 RepID=A0A7W4W551_9GAMM|nr:SDR family NAD(P)-dependent oxidoreductase [Litorivivens lipolytica]MBB3047589.1 short-subunit dehydrogenase [Litorivivens lipolytica]